MPNLTSPNPNITEFLSTLCGSLKKHVFISYHVTAQTFHDKSKILPKSQSRQSKVKYSWWYWCSLFILGIWLPKIRKNFNCPQTHHPHPPANRWSAVVVTSCPARDAARKARTTKNKNTNTVRFWHVNIMWVTSRTIKMINFAESF